MNFTHFYLTKLAEAQQPKAPETIIKTPPIRPTGAAPVLQSATVFNTGDPLRQQILKRQAPRMPPLATGPLQRAQV